MNDEMICVGCEAIKILNGETKQQALERIHAEGQVFQPKHQDIIGHEVIGAKRLSKKYRVSLAGMKLFMWNYKKHPIFRISLKSKRVELRYRPHLVHIHGNDALLMFDRRRPRFMMNWLRMFAAIMPFRTAFQNDPAPHCIVARVPTCVARMFLSPSPCTNG